MPVPPPTTPVVPPVDQAQINEALAARLDQARLGLMVAVGLETQAAVDLAAAEQAVADTQAARDSHRLTEREAVVRFGRQRERVRSWAVDAYTSGGLRPVSLALAAEDLNEVPRRLGLARGALRGARASMSEQAEVLDATTRAQLSFDAAVAEAEGALVAARAAVAEATTRTVGRRGEAASLDAGQIAALVGVAFPVPAATGFSDTWGAPRMSGTPLAHPHQGTDVFAPSGSPMVAFERGIVTRLGTDLLGGTKLWLVGQSGTRYYYAHALGYAPGLAEGQLVEVGQTLAYVGNTGNARTTPPHLHFEMHPGGGEAVNPYPALAMIRQASHPG
ncbi:MAG TPA: M23 family metallopeptidase [Acidimicrobiales bacterium]|nr:M23 family metallopeptidase [Acidimicrobiales bacterium]